MIFANATTGVITADRITVTATTNSKVYDGTTAAAAIPTVPPNSIQTGDTANFTETYASSAVGTNLKLTPAGIVSDGNSGNNYAYNFVAVNTGVISARTTNISVGLSPTDVTVGSGSTVTATITDTSATPAFTPARFDPRALFIRHGRQRRHILGVYDYHHREFASLHRDRHCSRSRHRNAHDHCHLRAERQYPQRRQRKLAAYSERSQRKPQP